MSQLKENLKVKKLGSDPLSNPSSKSKKRISLDTSKSSISSRENKLKPILISTTPGNAIMGYALDEAQPKKLPPLQETSLNRNPNQELETRVESAIVTMLQVKCSELAKEAEEDKASKKQAELENTMLKSQIINLERELRQFSIMMNDERGMKGKHEENAERFRDMLNKANREVGKLKQDLKLAEDNYEGLKKEFNEFKKEKQMEARSYEEEIDRLRRHLDELEEEHEELKSNFQVKSEINVRFEEERKKYLKEIENKSMNEIEAKLEKIHKLTSDNAVLSEKLAESEKIRKRYQERHAYEEEKIKALNEKNQSLENSLASLKKQLNDSKSLKSYNHKIYEEKIINLTEQLDKLKKENAKLKRANGPVSPTGKGNDEDGEEILQPVQAKPFLFGPIDTGKF